MDKVSIASCPTKRTMADMESDKSTYLLTNPLWVIQFLVSFSFLQTWHGAKLRIPYDGHFTNCMVIILHGSHNLDGNGSIYCLYSH